MEDTSIISPARGWPLAIHLIIAVCITMTAALPGLLVPEALQGWFATLVHPSFAPPNWVFGPVWTFLYWLMGIAAGLVWVQQGRMPVKQALTLYGSQLVLNSAWTLIFFGMHSPTAALVVIVALLLMILLTMRSFFPIHRSAAWMMLPYLLWVAFATILNAAYVWLN